MAAQEILAPWDDTLQTPTSARITLPDDFAIHSQNRRLKDLEPSSRPPPPLGVLEKFTGAFHGTGFNTIFRPNSNAPTTTTFLNAVNPPPPTGQSENVLELNLTRETLSFSKSLGEVPNRGLQAQNDIFLNGVPYIQVVKDVTNLATGKADKKPDDIHFEPGLWMNVPASTSAPVLGATLNRMASIPHGTTINAQGLAPTSSTAGRPQIPAVDMTPFVIDQPTEKIPFISQTALRTDTPRLPQDLSKFIANGTITQDMLTDPNVVLRDANRGLNIKDNTVFTVTTEPLVPGTGAGTSNHPFLQGKVVSPTNSTPNASAVQMVSTFWVSTLQYTLSIPTWKVGNAALRIQAPRVPGPFLQPTAVFSVTPPKEITTPRTITVFATQIQYSQTVMLNFNGLTWPHVSVATLVPADDVVVPASAFT